MTMNRNVKIDARTMGGRKMIARELAKIAKEISGAYADYGRYDVYPSLELPDDEFECEIEYRNLEFTVNGKPLWNYINEEQDWDDDVHEENFDQLLDFISGIGDFNVYVTAENYDFDMGEGPSYDCPGESSDWSTRLKSYDSMEFIDLDTDNTTPECISKILANKELVPTRSDIGIKCVRLDENGNVYDFEFSEDMDDILRNASEEMDSNVTLKFDGKQ